MVLTLSIILLLAGLALLWLARRLRQASGLPTGRVVYSDTRAWGKVEKPFYDPELGLAGRPDYLVQQGATFIPVEVKSTRLAGQPYAAHVYQLAAYCLLVEREYGHRPPYGILHYPDRTLAIDYTPELRQQLLQVLAEMRACERTGQAQRSHQSPARCAACGYHAVCDQIIDD